MVSEFEKVMFKICTMYDQNFMNIATKLDESKEKVAFLHAQIVVLEKKLDERLTKLELENYK